MFDFAKEDLAFADMLVDVSVYPTRNKDDPQHEVILMQMKDIVRTFKNMYSCYESALPNIKEDVNKETNVFYTWVLGQAVIGALNFFDELTTEAMHGTASQTRPATEVIDLCSPTHVAESYDVALLRQLLNAPVKPIKNEKNIFYAKQGIPFPNLDVAAGADKASASKLDKLHVPAVKVEVKVENPDDSLKVKGNMAPYYSTMGVPPPKMPAPEPFPDMKTFVASYKHELRAIHKAVATDQKSIHKAVATHFAINKVNMANMETTLTAFIDSATAENRRTGDEVRVLTDMVGKLSEQFTNAGEPQSTTVEPDALTASEPTEDTNMPNQEEAHTTVVQPPAKDTDIAFKCKPPVFPKFITGANLDGHFAQLERYFRLSKVPDFAQIDFALLSIPQFSDWWDSYTTTRDTSIPLTWTLFKDTMSTFMVGHSPVKAALSRLLTLKQSTFSADKYSRMFMNLVRQSNTPPTEGWLVHHFLMGLTDHNLRRQLTANKDTVWTNLASLIQHMSHMLSFEVTQSRPFKPGHKQHQHAQSVFKPKFDKPQQFGKQRFQKSGSGYNRSANKLDVARPTGFQNKRADGKVHLNAGAFAGPRCNFCKGANASTHDTQDCKHLAKMLPNGFNKPDSAGQAGAKRSRNA
jgi:Retrotransposon gag protein